MADAVVEELAPWFRLSNANRGGILLLADVHPDRDCAWSAHYPLPCSAVDNPARAPARPTHGQAQGRDELIAAADAECAVLLVGVRIDFEFVLAELFGEQLRLRRLGEMQAVRLKEGLELRDQEGLADLDLAVALLLNQP
ncbi:MAG: hypothetical protein KDD47_16965 [Acidobacteria bacterium]|nr:hypothetical protein [Acidobacteriota bacterium]